MTTEDKLEKIKKLADDMYYAAANLGANVGSGERLRKTMEEYYKFIIHEYNKEEPVSEDFETALEKKVREAQDWTYIEEEGGECPLYEEFGADDLEEFARWGANWQKQQFEKNRLKRCNSITNEQAELEQGFIDQHLDKYNRMPGYLDAIEYGIDYGKQQMIKDAVDGIVEYKYSRSGKDLFNVSSLKLLDAAKYGLNNGKKVKLIILNED